MTIYEETTIATSTPDKHTPSASAAVSLAASRIKSEPGTEKSALAALKVVSAAMSASARGPVHNKLYEKYAAFTVYSRIS